jgi:hypothetical protein
LLVPLWGASVAEWQWERKTNEKHKEPGFTYRPKQSLKSKNLGSILPF